jgi:hypothetical protein
MGETEGTERDNLQGVEIIFPMGLKERWAGIVERMCRYYTDIGFFTPTQGKQMTSRQRDEMCRLYVAGFRQTEIVRISRWSRPTVRAAIDQFHMTIEEHLLVRVRVMSHDIITLFQDGKSLPQISVITGIGRKYLVQILIENQIVEPDHNFLIRCHCPVSDNVLLEMLLLATYDTIHATLQLRFPELDITRSTMQRWIEALDFPIGRGSRRVEVKDPQVLFDRFFSVDEAEESSE